MSIKVKKWLKLLGVETTHEERMGIDREIELVTGLSCEEGVNQLTEEEFLVLVNKVKRRRKRKEGHPEILAETLA